MEFEAIKDAIRAKMASEHKRDPEKDRNHVASVVVDYIKNNSKFIVSCINACRVTTPLQIHTGMFMPEYRYLSTHVEHVGAIEKLVLDATGLTTNIDITSSNVVIRIHMA